MKKHFPASGKNVSILKWKLHELKEIIFEWKENLPGICPTGASPNWAREKICVWVGSVWSMKIILLLAASALVVCFVLVPLWFSVFPPLGTLFRRSVCLRLCTEQRFRVRRSYFSWKITFMCSKQGIGMNSAIKWQKKHKTKIFCVRFAP